MEGLDGSMRDAIHGAIAHLASVCDHAVSLDDVGFSANTASLGHELAHLPARFWNDGTYVAAARIVFKHRHQAIRAAALDTEVAEAMQPIADGPTIEDVASGWMIVDRLRDGVVLSLPKDRAPLARMLKKLPGAKQPAGKGRLWAIDARHAFALLPHLSGFELDEGAERIVRTSFAAATPEMVQALVERIVDVEKADFTVAFPYDKDVVAMVQAMRRRRYDGKRWLVAPSRAAAELMATLKADHGFATTASAEMLMLSLKNAPEGRTIASELRNGRIVLSFAYDAEVVAAVKGLPAGMRAYDPASRSWSVDPSLVPDLTAALEALSPPPTPDSMDALRRLAPQGPRP